MPSDGTPYATYEPSRPDGTRRDNVRGTHVGRFDVLNVENPEPGKVYYHARHDKLREAVYSGWRPTQASSGVVRPETTLDPNSGTPIDSGDYRVQDVVLCEMDEGEYAKFDEQRQVRAARHRGDPAAEWAGGSEAKSLEEQYERHILFQDSRHSLRRK